jgi:RNA polymerase subunit RPABC4/transcription elongation factor Spt4
MIDECDGIDECNGCVNKYFADKWVDFINHYIVIHPEFYEEFKRFSNKKKVKK